MQLTLPKWLRRKVRGKLLEIYHDLCVFTPGEHLYDVCWLIGPLPSWPDGNEHIKSCENCQKMLKFITEAVDKLNKYSNEKT